MGNRSGMRYAASRYMEFTVQRPAQLQDFLEGVPSRVVSIGEIELLGSDRTRPYLLDEPIDHRPSEGVSVDDFSLKRPLVRPEWSGRHADDLRVRKAPKHLLPTRGCGMMALVDQDHVEEVRRELGKPSVSLTCELLNVGDDELAFYAVMKVRRRSVENCRSWAGSEVGEHACPGPEALAARDVEGVGDATPDGEIRGDHEYAAAGDSERQS